MIKSVDELDFNKNFILSAINLAFLGYYGTGRTNWTHINFGQTEYISVNCIKKKFKKNSR